MSGITVRDENGNVILSSSDYYLRKVDTITVTSTELKKYFSYSGMSHSSHIIAARGIASGAAWNYVVTSIVNGGFWLFSQDAKSTYASNGSSTSFTIDIYKRN